MKFNTAPVVTTKQLMPCPAYQNLSHPCPWSSQCHPWPSWRNFVSSWKTTRSIAFCVNPFETIPSNIPSSPFLRIWCFTLVEFGYQGISQLLLYCLLNTIPLRQGATPKSLKPWHAYQKTFIGTTIRKAESKGKGRNLKREDRENGECVVVSLALAV